MIVHLNLTQTVFVYIALIEKKIFLSVDCVAMKWLEVPALLLTSSVILSKFPNISVSQFFYL